MSDILILTAAWLGGSLIWLMMQIAAYALMVKTYESYSTIRGMAVGALIAAPTIVFIVCFVTKLWDSTLTWGHVVVMPLFVAWVIMVSLTGLHLAARWRGVLGKETQK